MMFAAQLESSLLPKLALLVDLEIQTVSQKSRRRSFGHLANFSVANCYERNMGKARAKVATPPFSRPPSTAT